MKFRLLSLVLIAALLLVLTGCTAAVRLPAADSPGSFAPPPGAKELSAAVQQQLCDGGSLQTRQYTLENGDTVQFGSFCAKTDLSSGTALCTVIIPSGTLHLYTPGIGWQTLLLTEGVYSGTLLVIDSEPLSWMAYLPQSWEMLENASRRYLDCGTLQVQAVEDGFALMLCAPAISQNNTVDFTTVASSEPLLDWSYPGCETLWSGYANSGDGRWCYDGYYWPAPDTYVPSGEQVYYRMTLPYLCRSFLGVASVYRLADDLLPCMLDVMLQQQNELGFFPTCSQSTWLWEDYQIAAGFYDSRFNNDLAEILNGAWQRYHIAQFYTALEAYAAFFKSHAAEHHRETANGGWLVEDYYHPDGNLPTHTSLNHQLSEILLLYHLSDTLSDATLTELADRMLQAISDTLTDWIRSSDFNLHYAVYPDGTFGGIDYPYLTYNDLYNLQTELISRRGSRDAELDVLMQSKKLWMDANGITGYKQ